MIMKNNYERATNRNTKMYAYEPIFNYDIIFWLFSTDKYFTI